MYVGTDSQNSDWWQHQENIPKYDIRYKKKKTCPLKPSVLSLVVDQKLLRIPFKIQFT